MRSAIRLLLIFLLCGLSLTLIFPADSYGQCCVGIRGNISNSGTIDLTDLALLIGYLTIPNMNLPCPEAANISGTGTIDLTDLAMLIGYLTIPNFVLPPCPADTGLMNPAARTAVVTAVEHLLDSLGELPSGVRNQQILAFVQGRTEFEATGISSTGNNVWARFTDGVLYLIGANFGELRDSLPGDPLPPDTFPLAPPLSRAEIDRQYGHQSANVSATYDDLPASARFRVIRTVGTAFASAITTSNRLRSWLLSNGYSNAGSGASVEEMKTIGGEGLIFYVGHGADGDIRNGVIEYGIWTTTVRTEANEITYKGDLDANRLCLFSAKNDTNEIGLPRSVTRYAITSRFISRYWGDLAPNAAVIMTACASDSVPAFRQAIQAKGGPAYFGWDATVWCDGGCYTAEFLVDRLLGANRAFPREDPKQRPFDVRKVFADLQKRGFHVQPGGDQVTTFSSRMRYHPGASNFGMLAPSIQFMALYGSSDTLTIQGLFGQDPGPDGSVTVDGVPLPIVSWGPTMVRCLLPLRGPGSAGPVRVAGKGEGSSDFRRSNAVNLTEWEGTVTQTREEDGTLKLTNNYNIRIRADIHSHRDDPGETPFKPITPFYTEHDATADWSVGGTGEWYDAGSTINYTYSWSGSGALPIYDSASAPFLTYFQYLGSVDAGQHLMTLRVDALIAEHWTVTEVATVNGFPLVTDYPGGWTSTMDYELYDSDPLYSVTVSLDNNFNALAGSRSALSQMRISDYGPVNSARLHMEWPAIPVAFPPDPNEAQ